MMPSPPMGRGFAPPARVPSQAGPPGRAAPFFSSVEEEEPEKELLDLAEELIERKSAPFDPDRFEDHYTSALRELIEDKAKHGKPIRIGEEETPPAGADLADALKRSVKSSERRSGAGRKKKKAS